MKTTKQSILLSIAVTIFSFINPLPGQTGGGCTDSAACNYDVNATFNDGSCILPDGCTDWNACNYDLSALCDDGSCYYSPCYGAVDDDFPCVNLGDAAIANGWNVLLNDLSNDNYPWVTDLSENPCFYIDNGGQIHWNFPDDESCCGDHTLMYGYEDGFGWQTAEVHICVICPTKPDCSLINLEDYFPNSNGMSALNPDSTCVYVCELSASTFYVDLDTNLTYTWGPVFGGTGVVGSHPAEFIVTWGPMGAGSITVTKTDANGLTTSVTICVVIMQSPTAAFTAPGYACLEVPIGFMNQSQNAVAYEWIFGDGTTDDAFNTNHAYTIAGTYTVALVAFNQNFDDDGNPLCCCSDTAFMEIIIDELPGPKILWVSTLCEGDESCYWTDAVNCTSYMWTVLDANGVAVPFTGQNTPNICLTWLIGPVGTIKLSVSGCNPPNICPNQTTVQVPIIPATSSVSGPIVVCENSTETYTVPKWLSTSYSWIVTGGTVMNGEGTHIATIQWGAAGIGTIHVDYHSDFLACLPNHQYPDCFGTADLTVLIKPQFDVFNYPSLVCVGDVSNISATAFPCSAYTWTISPSVPFTLVNSSNISINWNTPGTYMIKAVPTDPTCYCNTMESVVVTVKDVLPPLGIDGPVETCPGETHYYTVQPNGSGVSWQWYVAGGVFTSIPGPPVSVGATVGVIWSGPVSISVKQVMTSAPFCESPPYTLNVIQKPVGGPFTISGSASCTNALGNYMLNFPALTPIHPDATIVWSVTPSTIGSIVGGQGTLTPQVQWNDTPGSVTLQADISLCNLITTVQLTLNLVSPIVPQIIPPAPLNICPGGSISVSTTAPFSTYQWSNGLATASANYSTTGLAFVQTTDANGCIAKKHFTINQGPGPVAAISTSDNKIICVGSTNTVTMVAQYAANYSVLWYCNGIPAPGANTGFTYTHSPQGAGFYNYQVVVTCNSCTNTSLILTVVEDDCTGTPPPPCIPDQCSIAIQSTVQTPNCNMINFSYTSCSNFTFSHWDFDDGNTSNQPSPTHTYSNVGCYNVKVYGTVPGTTTGTGAPCTAPVWMNHGVCVPLVADFNFAFTLANCGEIVFADLSTRLPGVNYDITSWSWSFGSSVQNPIHTFTPGTHSVTLTVTNASSCQASITKNIVVTTVGIPAINASPSPAWVGVPIGLSATASNAVSIEWDFGDLATFVGQTPFHTYTTAGTYTVTVIAKDAYGCTSTSSISIIVLPVVPPAVITGALVICQGATTQLCAPPGYNYLWSPGLNNSQCISVGAGTYSVVITDAFGCVLELAPVDVVEIPLPDATIAGNLVICGAGCATLSAAYVPGYMYNWTDGLGNSTQGLNLYQFVVCTPNVNSPYTMSVTDLNGCTGTSSVNITLAVSPNLSVAVSPTACPNQPVTLTVSANPINPNVHYNWSNGATGTSIVVTQAGTYTVVGTDITTGCSGVASGVVHPLPDFCIVPQGCYKFCAPKTICGPAGLAVYQWNLNNVPIGGANSICYTATQSGKYTLTGTTMLGCTATSGELILEKINCNCDDLEVYPYYSFDDIIISDTLIVDDPIDFFDFNYIECCAALSYTNDMGNIKALAIHTTDAEIDVDLSSVSSSLNVFSLLPNSMTLTSSIPGSQIPYGVLTNFVEICLVNVVSDPQFVFFDWYDFNNQVICQDTLIFHCPVEPDCLYLKSDSVYCENGEIKYEFTVCNPHDGPFDVGYFNINPSTLNPCNPVLSSPFIVPAVPIAPGQCHTFTITLTGDTDCLFYCFNLVAHQGNPLESDSIICCSLDTVYCFSLPICDPCELVGVGLLEGPPEGECCVLVYLENNYSPTCFDAIDICVITPATTINISNPLTSGWTTSNFTGTSASFLPEAIFGYFVPGGIFTIPVICVESGQLPNPEIEIKWMVGDSIVCRDTIFVFCEPPCGYLVNENIYCDPFTGLWNYTASIFNSSPNDVTEAEIDFANPAFPDQTIVLGSLSPYSTSAPFTLTIGFPGLPGDVVCFQVTLITQDPLGNDVECCFFDHCIILPLCEFEPVACLCDDEMQFHVSQGISCTPVPGLPYAFYFSLIDNAYFMNCDQVKWRWGDGSPLTFSNGPDIVSHTFLYPGTFTIKVRVTRYADDGTVCYGVVTKTIEVTEFSPEPEISFSEFDRANVMLIYPNPNDGVFKIALDDGLMYPMSITIFNSLNQPVWQKQLALKPESTTLEIDLTDKAKGMYVLHSCVGGEVIARKIVIQ